MEWIMESVDWGTLANIATVIEAIIVLVAAIYAAAQLQEARRSRNLTATMQMIDLLGNDLFKDSLSKIRHLPSNPNKLTADEWKIITQVCYPINRVGAIIYQKMIDPTIVLELYAETISSSWRKLQPYIYYRRTQTHPRWCLNFERIANITEKFQDNYLKSQKLQGKTSHELV